MNYHFHPEAEAEFGEAVRHYEDCRAGLGIEFAEEVYAAVLRVLEYPEAWSQQSVNTRRCLVNRFPYGVIYRVKTDAIHIIAVANLHRRPGYWKGRV